MVRTQQFEGQWRSANGTDFGITDAVHNPSLMGNAVGMLIREDLPARWINVGGIHGRILLIQSDKAALEACVLLVPDSSLPAKANRMVIIQMYTSMGNFKKAQAEFADVVKSFRVLHIAAARLEPSSNACSSGCNWEVTTES